MVFFPSKGLLLQYTFPMVFFPSKGLLMQYRPFQWSFSHQKVYWCNRPFQWYYTHFKHCDATKVRCCKLKQHVAASSTGVYFSQQIVFQLATTKFCCVTMSDVGGNTCNNTFQLRFFSWRKMLPVLPGLKSIVFYY